MAKKEETFNYVEWLTKLKVGDKIKTSQCSHSRSCSCDHTLVSGITTMFGESCVVLQVGCTVSYFSKKNGRELGGRKGQYKNGCLTPFTKEDQEKIDKAILEKENKERVEKSINEFVLLLSGKADKDSYYLRNGIRDNVSADRMEDLMKLITKNESKLRK